MKNHALPRIALGLVLTSIITPGLLRADDDLPQCDAEVPLTLSRAEMAEAGFEPGGGPCISNASTGPNRRAILPGPRILIRQH